MKFTLEKKNRLVIKLTKETHQVFNAHLSKITTSVCAFFLQSCVPGGRRRRDAENNEVNSGEVIAVVRIGHLTEQDAVQLICECIYIFSIIF